ncbi:hypothetical protein AALA98_04190 [Lachnospiraceae bacterium 45-W7]
MQKKFSARKKAVFAIAVFFVIANIIWIAGGNGSAGQYHTSADIETKAMEEVSVIDLKQKFRSDYERLDKLELIFSGIAEEESGYIQLAIASENQLLYQTKISLKNINNLEWKQIFVNMPVDREKEYEISLTARGCTVIPKMLLVPAANASPETLFSSARGGRLGKEIAVKYGYLSPAGLSERIEKSLVWLILLAVFLAVPICFERMRDIFVKARFKFYSMKSRGLLIMEAELVLGLAIVIYSGIKFHKSTEALFYLISVFAAWNARQKWKFVQTLADKRWKKTGLCLVYLYAAFSLVGQRTLLYPFHLQVTVRGLLVFAAAVLWFIPVVHTVLYYFCQFSIRFVNENSRKMKTSWFLLLLFVFLLAPALLNLYANNPGISSPDTFDCMVRNAHHLRGMRDWHPFFYCLILKVILTVWDSTYAVILVQYFFWTYVMTEGLLYLRKKGMKDGVLLAAAFLSGINTANFIHLNTVWKDIPYALSALWTVVLLSKLAFDFETYKSKRYIYFELTVALAGIFLYRKNGIVTFAAVALAICFVFCKNKKALAVLAATALLILTVRVPLYSYFEVQSPGREGMYIGLSQDILGVYYAGGRVSAETLQMINVMTDYNNAEYDYKSTYYSHWTCDLDVEPLTFMKAYLETFVKNPVVMTRAVISREDALWNIFPGKNTRMGCVNYTETMDEKEPGWNQYYPARKDNALYPKMSAFTAYTAKSQWLNALVWRCGVLTLLSVILLFLAACERKNRKYVIVLSPVIGHILSLLLSTGWSDFRYFWPLNLMNIYIMLFVAVISTDKESEKGERL